MKDFAYSNRRFWVDGFWESGIVVSVTELSVGLGLILVGIQYYYCSAFVGGFNNYVGVIA